MYRALKDELDNYKVKLVTVSKTQPTSAIMAIYLEGQRIFGENRPQELVQKYKVLPKDIEWHMIGHLQTNKVKLIAPFISCIHSVDSPRLLGEINNQASKNNRIIDCFLQMKIAKEESKYGLSLPEANELLESDAFKEMKNVRITGLMGMATFTFEENQIRAEFQNLKRIYDEMQRRFFPGDETFKEISMGMSGDYKIAVEEGCTIVRIGSLIFGPR